ncbi:arginine--tRNA ligase [Halobacterium bonnevillei]|uniref:Arginine--tRNA ligase n=1 Tax=Halobacterium bonnevillei TaxID=2692200 RepID=A0A6B0SNE7_9EURY|nr:arginine--tRNA ligase [Halobacterium bonnevillei]MXR20370.1 arginine--tRNA ligase [Halobacterium bonnevillei]
MFIAFRREVEAALEAALDDLGYPTGDLGIEEPPADVPAVLASSVAFRLASDAQAPPPQVAGEIADAIDLSAADLVADVSTQGPYVNFTPSDAYFQGTLEDAQADEWGRLPDTGESVVVEHTSANPTGPVHVGRARNPILGDALARILDFAGYDVTKEYYVNDAGRQMAVFTWAYETFDESDLPEPERDKPDYDFVRYYRKGNEFLEEGDPAAVEEAEAEIASIIEGLDEGDEDTLERTSEVVDTVLGGMQETLGRLPAEFDEFVKETRFLRDGSTHEVVDRLQDSEYAFKEEGAWQLDLDDWDIEQSFVFLRSDDTTLYTTRDLAHHEWKFDSFDSAITVLGEDQELHANKLEAALDILGNDTDQLEAVFYAWVNLPGGESMSTRQGTGVDMDDLLDEAVNRAEDAVRSRLDDRIRGDDLTEADVERIARQVGIGAVRYDIVSKQPTKAITFDWEDALDFEGQSAPYVQYAHARACGISAEAGDLEPSLDAAPLDTQAERDLLEGIARFPAVVEAAAADREPHQVATFAREFVDTFNAFYRSCPVVSDDVDDDTAAARLALVDAARNTLANALGVLGIESPDSM